jgi:cysteinyl-tRNA synthetase
MRSYFSVLCLAACCLTAVNCGSDDDGGDLTLADVDDFAYWLQDIDLGVLGASRFDLAIIDYSRDGGDAGKFSPDEIAALKESAGGPKVVLAYISVGEAEDYRWYWRASWEPGDPPWLGPENPAWPGNYPVRFWNPEWQAIVFEYLDRIQAAGFDGVYLDRVDVYEEWSSERPTARADMAAFVAAIADYCRARAPAFYVFPQNGHELIDEAGYAGKIDGLGSEDNYYDGEKALPPAEVAYREEYLDKYVAAGKKVLVVDYCRRANLIDDVYARAASRGYVPYCTVRDLDRLVVNAGHEPD